MMQEMTLLVRYIIYYTFLRGAIRSFWLEYVSLG